MSELEIRDELKDQGVIEVRRVTRTKGRAKVPTNTLFLTFNQPCLPKEIKVGYLKVNVDLLIRNPLRCFNCNDFGHTSQRCKSTAKCTQCGKDKHEGGCDGPKICSNCNGSHASSTKDCPVWQKEKEIQRIRVEKRISFPEARQLVEAKMPSTLSLSHTLSFSDVVNKKKTCKVCGMSDRANLGFLVQTVRSVVCVSGCRIGIDRYPGFPREVRAGFGRRPGTLRVRFASGQKIWVLWCWIQFFSQTYI